MTRLTGKKIPFCWDSKCEQSFISLKERLNIAPILIIPYPSKPYKVFCDAYKKGLGGVLRQGGQVVVYASCQLKTREDNYRTHDLELVVVVFTFKVWRHCLYGVHFEMFSDHKSMKYLFD